MFNESSFHDEFGDCLRESTMPVDGDRLTKVAIGGYRSRNGREYTEQALNDIVKLSEGIQCFIDHPKESEARDRQGVRSVRDLIGAFTNGRRQDGKPFADLQLVGEHKRFVQELAVKMPRAVGFSINAPRNAVKSTRKESVEIIEGISALNSIDLVTAPGLTKSMFEQMGYKRNPKGVITMTDEQIEEAFDRVLGGDDFWWRKECEKSQPRRVQEQKSGAACAFDIDATFEQVLP